MIELIPIDRKFIHKAWAMGAHRLSEACDVSDGQITGDQLKMILCRGERQLISMVRDGQIVGWAVIRFDDLPNMRVCFVTDMWAPGAGFAEFLDRLWIAASAEGCSEIHCEAKAAQARLYKRAGFEPVRTLMRYRK